MGASVAERVHTSEKVGLQNTDPHHFHQSRKALRSALNAINASAQSVSVNQLAVHRATELVELYGQAQDANTCAEWLKDKGFHELAQKVDIRFESLQRHALERAQGFELASLKTPTRLNSLQS